MEASWERADSFRRLSREEVVSYLAPLGQDVVEYSLLAEGKANTNYLVRLADGDRVVLRLHMRDPKTAALEKAIADRLWDRIPVPRVLYYDSERHLSIVEWKPGKSIERLIAEGNTAEIVQAAKGIGRALAVTTDIHFDSAGFLDSDLAVTSPWPSSIEGLLGYLDYCLGREVVTARVEPGVIEGIRSLIQGWTAALEAASGPPCLVHGDYKASNLLVEGGEVSGILDWEFAHSGTYLLSIGQLFRHGSHLPNGFEEDFEKGFGEAGRTLPDDWRWLARVLDLINLVDFLGREHAGPEMLTGVIGLIEATLASA